MRASRLARNIRLGIKNLLLHKLRSFLTMLGVVFGVGSVIAMLAVGEGASKEALEQIRKLGSNNIIIYSVKPAELQTAQKVRVFMGIYGLLYEDARRITETVPTVNVIAPAKVIRKQGRFDERAMELRIVGTTPSWFKLVRRTLTAGRVLTGIDEFNRRYVVVLTEHGARKLLATREGIGEWLRLGSLYFQVVGIVRSEGSSAGTIQTPDTKIDAYIPLSVAKECFGDIFVQRRAGSWVRELVELHQIIVEVDSLENVESTAKLIERTLRKFHKREDFRISIPLVLLKQAEATKRTFNIVLGSIAGISLLVGGVGIMNIMLASTVERTREIGIRRAIGAKKRQIVAQFLVETVVLSTAGGFVGTLLGLLIPYFITRFTGVPSVVTVYSVVLSLVISVGVGIVFGIYPAWQAANLDPIEALRHE